MASRRLIAVTVAIVACAAAFASPQWQPPAQTILGCPGAPWCPVWVNCSYAEAPGASCHDCSTRVICTPVGGLLRPCLVPGLKHCVNGLCRLTPSEECASEAPTEAATEAHPGDPETNPEHYSAPQADPKSPDHA